MILRGRLRESNCALALLCAAMVAPTWGFATPTGLNNIPTADVVPTEVLVWQAFAQFGEDRAPTWFAGF